MVPLPRSDRGAFSSQHPFLMTGLRLGPLHSTTFSCNRPRPLPVLPPSDWPWLLLSQISSQLFLFTRPMKMEQSVPKRRHIKFRGRGIAQKKEYNRQTHAMHFVPGYHDLNRQHLGTQSLQGAIRIPRRWTLLLTAGSSLRTRLLLKLCKRSLEVQG